MEREDELYEIWWFFCFAFFFLAFAFLFFCFHLMLVLHHGRRSGHGQRGCRVLEARLRAGSRVVV